MKLSINKVFFVIVLFFSNHCMSQIHSGEVIYKGIRIDYTKKKSSTKKDLVMQSYLNDINNSVGDIEFNLIFNDSESLFKVIDKLDIDESSNFKMALAMRGGRTVYYTNLINKELLVQKEAFSKLFLIGSPLEKYNWQLFKESKMIKGYQCYKATTIKKVVNSKGEFNHLVTAWYAPKIPIKFGPSGYGNLPGLILELTVSKLKFSVLKIEFERNKMISVTKPSKGKRVSEKEFEEIVNGVKIKF